MPDEHCHAALIQLGQQMSGNRGGMQVAVVGGAGTAGRYAVEALREQGHSAPALSRRTGVDVYTGAGLDGALAGVDVVVDTLNISSLRRARSEDLFTLTPRPVQTPPPAQRGSA